MRAVGLVTGIVAYITLAALAPASSIELLVGLGLGATTYVLCRRGARLYSVTPRVVIGGENAHLLLDPVADSRAARGYSVVEMPVGRPLRETLSSVEGAPDLMVIPLDLSDHAQLDELRVAREESPVRGAPILAVADLASVVAPTPSLRAHGIVSIVDQKVGREKLLEDVESILGISGTRRSAERAPCFMPVEIARRAQRGEEYALDLSASGMRLTSRYPIDCDARMKLRFRLPMLSGKAFKVRARVVHRAPKRTSDGRYEIGVTFEHADSRSRRVLEWEVSRLLTL